MTWRVGDDKRDTSQEGKEWERRRVEKAFDVARQMRAAEWEKRKRDEKSQTSKPRSIGDLADYLLTAESKTIDKLVKDDLRREQEDADKARSDRKRTESFGREALGALAAGFKAYMENKHDSQQPKDDSPQAHTKDTSKSSFKDIMSNAREIRKQRDPKESQGRLSATRGLDGQLKEDASAKDVGVQTENSHRNASQRGKNPSSADGKPNDEGKERLQQDEASEPKVRERGVWKVKIHHPEIEDKKIESFDEVREHIKDVHPGLMKHGDINNLLDQGEKHWKTVEHFEGRKEVTNREMHEFAQSIDASDSTVRPWVTRETSPKVYSLMTEATPLSEAVETIEAIRDKLGDLRDVQSWRERMKDPYFQKHIKQTGSWEEDRDSAEKFYRFLDEMEKGGTVADVSRRVGIGQSTGTRYLEGRIPTLVKAGIESSQLKVKEYDDLLPMKTKEELQKAIERHNHLQDRRDFPELKRRATVYLEIKEAQAKHKIPNIKQRDWARQLGISHTALNHYLQDKKRPELFTLVNASERALRAREERLAQEALEHWINPSLVYETFRNLKDIKRPTPAQLAGAIEKLQSSSSLESRVQFADMKPYYRNSPEWLKKVAMSIAGQRSEIEDSLNKRMGLDRNANTKLQIGIVGDRLYIRLKDTDDHNWMNIYNHEDFQLRRVKKKRELIEATKARLNLGSTSDLARLIDQMNGHDTKQREDKEHYDLRKGHPQIKSESLHFILDSTNQVVQDIQSAIKRVGRGRYGITNPLFPRDTNEINRMFASILGAGLSDGHVARKSKEFVYTESNAQRVAIFNEKVKRFGEVYHSESKKPNGVIRTRYSSSFGKALESRGLTSGDKALHNKGFPDWLKNASPEALRDYYSPMWAQEASFKVRKQDQRAELEWDRGVALHDQSKQQAYDCHSAISEKHVSFLAEYGKKKDDSILGSHKVVVYGRLRELANHPNERTSAVASELLQIALENPPRLMVDEKDGLEKLGISITPYLSKVTYYENTGRVSSLWHARTNTNEDAMRAVILAPPEDIVKRNKVERWIKERPDLARKVQNDLMSEGLMRPDGRGFESGLRKRTSFSRRNHREGASSTL